jgi:transposase-like protein
MRFTAVVSDGQHAIRAAVAAVFPGVPHQLCHSHLPREAARPTDEADRHAEEELKKKVRTGWAGHRSKPGANRPANRSGF